MSLLLSQLTSLNMSPDREGYNPGKYKYRTMVSQGIERFQGLHWIHGVQRIQGIQGIKTEAGAGALQYILCGRTY